MRTILDKDEEKFIVVMDLIEPNDVIVGGEVKTMDWTEEYNHKMLFELAKFHSRYLGDLDNLKGTEEYIHMILSEFAKFHSHYLGDLDDLKGTFQDELKVHPRRQLNAIPFLKEFANVARKKYQQQFTESRVNLMKTTRDLDRITEEIESFPMALVHNDTYAG